ncbi:MAG: hypothetical protein DHS20C19_05530 [Acidimicrobiales bacterium]|nr:MAG: hypothetical protein DHS20C19_05530 [Acidimicrobiales bacterium]
MSEQVWWYATRAAGMMTWTTATASVVFGLLLSTKKIRARTGPWFLDLHRFLGGVSVVFLIAHILTLWADGYVDFGPRELFVPGASDWKPEAIAWGIIAAYLIIAVEVTSLLRARMNNTVWRAVHFSSFAAMIGGSYHAFLAGSDVDNPVTWAIAGVGSLLVMGLVSMRLQRQDPDEAGSARLADNRAILEEMRQRLEDLPIPETTPQPQISSGPSSTLPRRAPISTTLPGIEGSEPDPLDDPIGFSSDPFAAVPLSGADPELGDWADPSSADPFPAGSKDPFLSREEQWEDDGADLFDDAPVEEPSLFESFSTPAPLADPIADVAPISHPSPAADLFAAAIPDDPFSDMAGNPFDPVEPTPTAIHAPVAAPQPVASASAGGPPPLPSAIDPVTGEPDEAAYSAWLKDWLAYAEQYGDETPDDPSRQ